ncbi:hypothetical protein ACPV5S_13945 [Vibrio astriarenae]
MRKAVLAAVVLGVLSGCGSDSDGEGDKTLSDSEVSALIKCSNLAEATPCTQNVYGSWGVLVSPDYADDYCNGVYCFADGSSAPEYPHLTRFRDSGELIPTYYLDAVDPRFEYALNKAEEIIGYQLFDRKGVISLEFDDTPFFDIDYSELPTDWGFIWSKGTLSGSCSSGRVSSRPYSTNLVSYAVGNDYGIDKTKWGSGYAWIQLDSISEPDPGCTTIANNEVSLHELAHALGMSNHFDGFGNGAAFNKNAERVLRNMYSKQNPAGQPFDSLNIEP